MTEALIPFTNNEISSGNPNLLSSNDYALCFQDVIASLLKELDAKKPSFSNLFTSFSLLIHAKIDPPIEILLFFSVLQAHELNPDSNDVTQRISYTKSLFQIICSCSGSNSVAVLAPVVPELCEIIREFYGKDSAGRSGKIAKKVGQEIDDLVDGVVKFSSLCSGSTKYDFGVDCCLDVFLRVWGKLRVVDGDDVSRNFFPMVTEEIRRGLVEEGCDLGVLGSVVMVEVFLVNLCSKIIQWRRKKEVGKEAMRKDLRARAVGAITGFRNLRFYGVLMKLLLAPALPVNLLLVTEEETLLRDSLLDAAILPDFTFLKSETGKDESDGYFRSLLLSKLVLTHKAIQSARSHGDHDKALSYIDAFSRSQLSGELLECVKTSGIEFGILDASTPQALLKKLLNLGDQSMKEFISGMSELGINLITDATHAELSHVVTNIGDDLFYVSNERQDPENVDMQQASIQFLTAAREMNDTPKKKNKKREKTSSTTKSGVKFVRHDLDDMPTRKTKLQTDAFGDESALEDPVSDEDDV